MLTITTIYNPATDLGYLLHKNPANVHTASLPFGNAYVFYPEAMPERCTAVLLLDINPVDLVRARRSRTAGASIRQYVNDRPYAASSFLSVAILRVFGTALTGRSKERPELAETPIPLRVRIAPLYSNRGEDLLRRLFEPLGYAVDAQAHVLDERIPEWGDSDFFTLTLTGTVRLSTLLTHLYVLVPVLDDEKHYWVGEDEVEKLLRRGSDWLGRHPERDLIVRRYLKYRRSLARLALARLVEEDQPDPEAAETAREAEEERLERPLSLQEQRIAAVLAVLHTAEVRSVIDLGCGSGGLLRELLKDRTLERIAGMDVSSRALEIARERLRIDSLPAARRERIALFHGSLSYRDRRLAGYDAAVAMEVIEHLDPWRLAAFEQVVFAQTGPRLVVLTTPNAEYNPNFPGLSPGEFRHRDHRFEWTRAQFREWTSDVGTRHDYAVSIHPVGPEDPQLGAPTQMAVLKKRGAD
ncbi:MAG TPA: 3' terminal RNA ribose 2'-O-methyltransferase Hen1 [bacterium]|jgi:3' terminal RNA ribose 2'-O-methyltransferase Hen1